MIDNRLLINLSYILMAAVAVFLVSRYCFVPLVRKLVNRKHGYWDDIIFSRRTLYALCNLAPMLILWRYCPRLFNGIEYWDVGIAKTVDILITIFSVRVVLSVLRSIHGLEKTISEEGVIGDNYSATHNFHTKHSFLYAHALYGTFRLIIICIGILISGAILFDDSLSMVFTGIGAGAAVLGMVFKEVIVSAISCIRLTQSDLLRPGDWITVKDVGIHGIVEDMSLTTVRVRNFDNTMLTIPPRLLMSGTFQNWRFMTEGDKGRRVMRSLFIDSNSVRMLDDGTTNLTHYREECFEYINQHPKVNHELNVMVRYMEAQSDGLPMELNFWVADQEWVNYENVMSDVIEHCIAFAHKHDIRFFNPHSPVRC